MPSKLFEDSQFLSLDWLLLYPPVLALLFLILAIPAKGGSLVVFVLCAAFWLAASLHISVHELVHRTANDTTVWTRALQYLATLLIGLPFHGYGWHHMNHHKFENAPEDYSTTLGSSLLLYGLAWPNQLRRSMAGVRREKMAGRLLPDWERALRFEKRLLFLTWVFWLSTSPKSFGLYLVVFYLGWMFIAAYNYFQHPPVPGNSIHGFSSGILNTIFLGNGYHEKHHAQPGLRWYRLLEGMGRGAYESR